MSAFANTNGGTLVVGVGTHGEIVGIEDPDDAISRLEGTTNLISPRVDIEAETVRVDGKSVLVVRVRKGHQPPYLTLGTAFQRSGVLVVPLTSQALYSGIRDRAISQEDLRAELERLSGIVETLNRQVLEARGWRAKIPEMILGGIIGALISFLISLLVGLF